MISIDITFYSYTLFAKYLYVHVVFVCIGI